MAQSFIYDSANRLIQVSSNCSGTKFSYDKNGNRLLTTQVSVKTTSKVIDERCGNDGQVSITQKDAAAKYRYLWNNGKTTATIKNLIPGHYSVVITDIATGFTCNQSFVIHPAFKDSITVTTYPALCYMEANGRVKVNLIVANPKATYAYRWSSSSDTTFRSIDSLSNLKAGDYTVSIRNSFTGCIKTLLFKITQPEKFFTGISTTGICYKANNGTAKAIVLNDPNSYSYSWTGPFSGTKTTQEITNLSPGKYIVMVTENKGNHCSKSDTLTLTAPTEDILQEVKTTSILCTGQNDGTATATVSGDPNSYVYNWYFKDDKKQLFQHSASVTGLKPGNYSLTITAKTPDSCKSIKAFVIKELSIDAQSNSLFPNPTTGKVTVVICTMKEIAVNYTITSMSGQVLAHGSQIGYHGALQFDLSKLVAAAYVLTISVDSQNYNYTIIKI